MCVCVCGGEGGVHESMQKGEFPKNKGLRHFVDLRNEGGDLAKKRGGG